MAFRPMHLPSIGRAVFAIGVAALGCQSLITGDFLRGLQPVPAWVPARTLWANATAIVLVAACAGILVSRRPQFAARAVFAWFSVFVIALHVPNVIAHPGDGNAWTTALEMLALGGAAAVLALPQLPALGRICFGATLPAFGCLHFIYRDYVASVIPGWIPGHMFWALATGIALIAAGASIVLQRKDRLAAILLTVMYGTWVVVLHVPRAVAAHRGSEWTSLFIAVAMCGACALIVRAPAHGVSWQRIHRAD
jgi:uncharacterized membrane protein